MAFPEYIQQFRVGDLVWIVVDLDRFTMISDATVGRVGCRAARVSNPRADDTGQAPEPGVMSPESAHGKGRCLQISWHAGVNLWNGRRRSRGGLRRDLWFRVLRRIGASTQSYEGNQDRAAGQHRA